MPPGRKTTIEHEEQAQRQVPALADELAGDGDDDIVRTASGRKSKKRCRIVSLKAEKMFSKYLISHGADHRPDQRADAAEDGHQHDFARSGPLHALGAGQRIGDRQQRAGEAGIHARDDEGGERIGLAC